MPWGAPGTGLQTYLQWRQWRARIQGTERGAAFDLGFRLAEPPDADESRSASQNDLQEMLDFWRRHVQETPEMSVAELLQRTAQDDSFEVDRDDALSGMLERLHDRSRMVQEPEDGETVAPTLLVAPTSVIGNWALCIISATPRMTCVAAGGRSYGRRSGPRPRRIRDDLPPELRSRPAQHWSRACS